MGIEPRLLSTYDTASVAETNTGTKKDKYVSPFVLKRVISEGIVGAESNTNKVSSISSSSTDVQYPTAKLVYDQLALKLAKTNDTITNIKEKINIVVDSVNNISDIDTDTSLVWYFTSDSTANWTTNFRANSSVTLNERLAVGESISGLIIATQGSTAYYPTNWTIDGNIPSVIKWEYGFVPINGTPNGIDFFYFTIIKTADATFTLLNSTTNFS